MLILSWFFTNFLIFLNYVCTRIFNIFYFFKLYFSKLFINWFRIISTSYLKTRTYGLIIIRNLLIICLLDCVLIDEEPLWEPLEWTLVQTWVLFILIFSWIAETLVSAKYGSFTGRDKRVYLGLYKGFWFVQIYFIFNLFLAFIMVVVPFYFEVYYNLSYVVSWWDWYNRIFFFKIIFCFSFIFIINFIIRLGLRWLNWKKLFLLNLIVTFIVFYLFFTQLILVYFSYNTDIFWYKKSGSTDYNSLSQGPLKWGWGGAGKDYFAYHSTLETFWFKNDSMFSLSLFLTNFFLVFSFLFLVIQNLVNIRKIYATKEVSYTFQTYASSNVNQFFFCLLYLFILTLMSWLYQFNRTPFELFYFEKINYLWEVLLNTVVDYFYFLFKK